MSSAEMLSCIVCREPASQRCSNCRSIAYCGRLHQKQHWKDHKDCCRPYEVSISPELGRHLVASRDLPAGTLVLTETPLVFAPKASPQPDEIMPCVGCYRPVSIECGERCAKCGWPVCSGLCPGLSDPNHHGLECIVLSLRPECAVYDMANYYRHDALLPLRCLLLQKTAPKKWKKLLELQSHIEDRTPDTDIYKETDEFIVEYLNKFLHAFRSVETQLNTHVVPEISKDLLHKICGIVDVNALEIRLNSGLEILAIYPVTSNIEHNCLPNTKHFFDVNSHDEESMLKISVKLVKPLLIGEHITTMYSHALWGTLARRQHLKDTKYFTCTCERCRDPTELGTYLSALKCLGDENGPCSGYQLPEDPLSDDTEWACSSCTIKIKNDQVGFLIAQMGEEVDQIQMTNPSITQLEGLLGKLSTFLHPRHYHLYSIKHSLVQLYGYQQGHLYHQLNEAALQKKIDMCKELIDTTLKIDPLNIRLSLYNGILHHELHQVLVWMAKLKKKENCEKKIINALIKEAKIVIEIALDALRDEIEGSAGFKLHAVIKDTERSFFESALKMI